MPTKTTTTMPCGARGYAVPWSTRVLRILAALLVAALKLAAPAPAVEAAEMAGLPASELASLGATLLVGIVREALMRTQILGAVLLLSRAFDRAPPATFESAG